VSRQHQIDRAVAPATGESLRAVRRLGFSVLAEDPADGETDLCLVHDCPRCGDLVPCHGANGDGLTDLARCPGCGLGFEPGPEAVYAAVTGTLARAAG
jgi:hypothetical protein